MVTVDELLARGRAAHEALMVDQVRIHRPGPEVFDRSTGTTSPGDDLDLYTGPARVKPFGRGASSDVQAGERELVLRDYVVSLPFSAVVPAGQTVLAGDRIEVIASPDARLQGCTLWVTAQQLNSQATAWRLGAEDRS